MRPAVVYQDNKSAMLLEQNGRGSSGKRTRHVNIRYYFVADRVAKGELTVEYCPTEHMIGDFFTKSLQGSKFKTFRAMIMGWSAHNANDEKTSASRAQECVGPENVTDEESRTDGQDSCDSATRSWSDVVRGEVRS